MDWLKKRKEEVDKLCDHCKKSFNEKQVCVFKHSIDFKERYPCKHMEGKRKWIKEVV